MTETKYIISYYYIAISQPSRQIHLRIALCTLWLWACGLKVRNSLTCRHQRSLGRFLNLGRQMVVVGCGSAHVDRGSMRGVSTALPNLCDYIVFIKLGHLRVKEGHLLIIIQDTGYKQSLLLAICMYGHSQWNLLIRTTDVLELRMGQGCLLKCNFKTTALTSQQVGEAWESAFFSSAR